MEDKDSKLDVYENLPSKDDAYGRASPWSDGRPVSIKLNEFKIKLYICTLVQ